MSVPPVQCVYVTEDCVREWKTGNSSLKVSQPVPMLRFLYELAWTMVRGELPFPKCKIALDSVIFLDKASAEKVASNFADIVSQMAQDLTLSGEFRSRLIKLARWLVESELVPVRLLQERCEEEFLGEAEFIKIKAQELKGKEVRVNTRLLYQQTKFNLLREESEGYAKLVTLLCRDSEAPTQKGSASTIGIIKSLIGHFDLDPNRVFDIVLECFEVQPDNDVFIELIPIFPKSHASQILGFKFQYYQRMEVSNPVPYGLYRLAALLVKQDFIDLDSIYAHLLPKNEEAFEHYSTFSSKRLDEANKIGKINLAATGKDLMDDEKTGDVTIDLFAALAVETDAVEERKSELQNSQTLGLLTGFLSVDDWYHAHVLFERLSPLNPVEHIQICDNLFRLIEKSISSPYDVIRQAHLQNPGSSTGGSTDAMDVDNPPGRHSFIDLPKELFQMLSCTGPFLYRDTMLLQKVSRVLRGYYLSALELVSHGDSALNSQFHGIGNLHLHLKEAKLRVEDALGACLLPSLQLVPANPAVGQEIWELMSLLPYEARYRLYGEWEKDDDRYPMLLAARQTAKLDTRRILKRLAKENLKQLGRMVAKLAHANPMTVLRTIVHQIEAYRDMITPVVDAFKYLTQLEYDILEYVVIERLALGGRDKLKDDGLNLSDWLQSLASFWGHLCKKYPSMELRGLFQYLVNQLKRGQGIELVLLQELIQQMANVQYTENLTEEQLDSMAGSETLKYQATSFGMTRNNKALIKSTSRLRDALLPKDEPKLATPLLLLLAQHRSLVLVNADAPYIKMVSEQFDRCHGTLLQYVDFLGSAVTPGSNYAILIPSLDDLVHLYHLDPEVAFLIYRPVMRLFKSQRTPNVCWPLDDRNAASDSSTNFESDPADHLGTMFLDTGSNKNPISWSYLLGTVKTMLPSKAWNSLSPDLYATFWGLTLYDLYVPKNRYEAEIAKLHASLKSLEEISDNSSSAITKRKKEKERIQESLDRLISELHKHEENVASVSRRLSYAKDKWLSSCPDTLKINMEFLQRCIFPRCTFSMPDAVYCAMFVHKLHSLGTPFFNTVNHIDVLICKTLQPMICCCTEYEVGRLGRFLYETLKIAYHWKKDESIYERECGNMPGFAVYYRYPNSQRVTYGQFIKVHWKWSQRITRLLIQCLESSEYMEIRNALIMLTKISSVFPVTRKSGINLEKRVAKIKSDEREDLKVLATGVAAALAARKPSWVTDEEFSMGYLDLKPAPSMTKSAAGNSAAVQSGTGLHVSQTESASGKHLDSGNTVKDQTTKIKTADGKSERTENITVTKSDSGQVKYKGSSMVNGLDAQSSLPSPAGQSGALKSPENSKQVEESISRAPDEHVTRNVESKTSAKRSVAAGSLLKPSKQDLLKEDGRSGKNVTRTSGSSSSDKDLQAHASDGRHTGTNVSSSVSANGNSVLGSAKGLAPLGKNSFDGSGIESKAEVGAAKSSVAKDDGNDIADFTRGSSSRVVNSPRHENTATSKSSDKIQKRAGSVDELDRLGKRRKGDVDLRDLESEVRFSEREKLMDPRLVDDKVGPDELGIYRAGDKTLERPKEKGNERYEREHRERLDRLDKSRSDDFVVEKPRDRSIERYGRERSVERMQERGSERSFNRLPDKAKDDRRAGRRDEDADRRYGATRHSQRLSPRHEEKEQRRSEETVILQEDPKRRKDDDFRDRKREEMKVEEKEREREKANIPKEDLDLNAATKRRKLKREHLSTMEPGEYSPVAPAPPPPSIGMSQAYDARDRKGPMIQHASYIDEPSLRIHGKEVANKLNRRDIDPLYDREWDDEKRQRADQKRRHRK
ncbi:THO complex subunit 2 isoform X2 [Lathyrus oleraceus]|uniref:THO complex subunit 2 n=2 Tax=Pisum sativum TaxID=3888 RepID=A0A9D4VFK3_PEA|nr:THO complex subunit 2 isoform X2 [Pisum sativum]KAI5382680.1 THO complex subunit 2, variant 2 [Pisum sativum]